TKISNEKNIFNFKYNLGHSVPVAARLLKLNKNKTVKIGLMPHGPVSYTTETLDDVESKYGKIYFRGFYFRIMSLLENNIFNKVDFVTVAAREGMESYQDINIQYEYKLFEVTSGLPPLICNTNKSDARKLLDIPDDKFIVGFFGRYNRHKGYDFFYDEVISSANEKVFFISAGIGPIIKKEAHNYKNFGWRSDINNLITACDIIVIPNRHTYFDLLPLECFSLSRPVAVSLIGGNKKLCSLTQAAIPFKLNCGELNNLVNNLSNNKTDYKKLESLAKKSYDELFSDKVFVTNHNSLLSSLNDFFCKGVE
ncbi:glycosyltransferase family 4 protein, partial [Salmonella enterica]|nr:glycosyltransferase family 4 protein [Salmonella enterica]